MSKNRREVRLIDKGGTEWVRASLSPSSIKRMIREFQRFDIWLREVSA